VDAPPATVSPLPQRRARRWIRPAAAAAAVLVIGGGIWAGLAATASSPPSPVPNCAPGHGCSEVSLSTLTTHRQDAKVIVAKGLVYLTPTTLPADNPARQIYVLWQIAGKRPPLAIGSFDVHRGSHATIKIGRLPAPYGTTKMFAISIEHGRIIPPSPSIVVAAGKVPVP
jgi:hypothetical protein